MERSRTKSMVIGTFGSRLRTILGAEAFLPDRDDYVRDWRQNLLPGVEPSLFESELRAGSGSELDWKGDKPPNFAAAISSAALAVNTFAPFKRSLEDLRIAGFEGFEQLAFERKCPTGLAKATPPNLDVLLSSSTDIVAIESKCTEFLTAKPAKFSKRYDQLIETLFEPGPLALYEDLKANPKRFSMLDAAQLIKHYLGLRNSFPEVGVTLLYLFWEPQNAADVEAYRRHRHELNEFASNFEKSEICFAAISYPELWTAWKDAGPPDWLRRHIAHLEERYLFEI